MICEWRMPSNAVRLDPGLRYVLSITPLIVPTNRSYVFLAFYLIRSIANNCPLYTLYVACFCLRMKLSRINVLLIRYHPNSIAIDTFSEYGKKADCFIQSLLVLGFSQCGF